MNEVYKVLEGFFIQQCPVNPRLPDFLCPSKCVEISDIPKGYSVNGWRKLFLSSLFFSIYECPWLLYCGTSTITYTYTVRLQGSSLCKKSNLDVGISRYSQRLCLTTEEKKKRKKNSLVRSYVEWSVSFSFLLSWPQWLRTKGDL